MDDGVKTRLHKFPNDSDVQLKNVDTDVQIFSNEGHPLGGKKQKKGKLFTLDAQSVEQAHRFALFNSDNEDVKEYIHEHEVYINCQSRKSKWAQAQNHSNEFARWLKDKVLTSNVPDHIFWLAKGPSATARRYTGYYANGYKFYTKSRDARCKTQNSGVSLTALTPSFAMYQVEKDDYGLLCMKMNKFFSVDDPFVIPSEVHQVWYSPDLIKYGLNYVMNAIPRDFFDHEGNGVDAEYSYWSEPCENSLDSLEKSGNENNNFSREDLAPTMINAKATLADLDDLGEEIYDDSDYDDTLWDWMRAEDDDEDVDE
uniref:Uncharacterized protein n=1 Tax=Chenopodium quinoa TaxID=63459 RepID=A0A803N452_CHEQI